MKFCGNQPTFAAVSALFGLLVLIVLLRTFFDHTILAFLQTILGVFFTVVGSGFFATIILQWALKRKFSFWEFASLALLNSMLVLPTMLQIEYLILRHVYDWYPLANLLAVWLAALAVLQQTKTRLPQIPSLVISFRHPLFTLLVFGLFFTFIQISMYPTLPDLDPYKWLFKYTYQFANHHLDFLERPLFGAYVFTGTRLTHLDIHGFFKYYLPFLYLITLFPAWLVAKNLPDKTKRWLFMPFVFVSPVVILYVQTAMPQTPLIILAYFFAFFLIQAQERKDELFFYYAGLIALLSFFFHQAGVILFISWLLVTLISKRRIFFKDKRIGLLLTLLIITNLYNFKFIFAYADNWLTNIVNRFFLPDILNLLYPASYSNIDHNAMGWSSPIGVIKYYAFHMGPLVGVILGSVAALSLFQKNFRRFLAREMLNPPFLTGCLTFLVFFTIAEIFPRFPNLALLPDRAWIFAGVFSSFFLFILLKYLAEISWPILLLAVLIFCLVISGSLYINYLKRFLITPAQLESAEWIKKHLPDNRVILSSGAKSLLPIYAKSTLVKISPEVYCSQTLDQFTDILNQMNQAQVQKSVLLNAYPEFLKSIQAVIDQASINPEQDQAATNHQFDTANLIIAKANSLKRALEHSSPIAIIPKLTDIPTLESFIPIEDVYGHTKIIATNLKDAPIFIYYFRIHPKNPYFSRPYAVSNWGIKPCPDDQVLFDQYPDQFQRVYQAKDEEIIIWQYVTQ